MSWRSSVRAEVWENRSGGGMERNLGVEARKQVRKLSRGQGPDERLTQDNGSGSGNREEREW